MTHTEIYERKLAWFKASQIRKNQPSAGLSAPVARPVVMVPPGAPRPPERKMGNRGPLRHPITIGSVSLFPVGREHWALIDTPDLTLVSLYTWHVDCADHILYAVTGASHFPMHRLISGVRGCDHKNGNGLDNRRRNLRPCAHVHNMWNRRRRADAASRFKGLRKNKATGHFEATIRVHGKAIHLGTFRTEESAARAYDAAAVKYFGEFARLNFTVRDEKDKEVQ